MNLLACQKLHAGTVVCLPWGTPGCHRNIMWDLPSLILAVQAPLQILNHSFRNPSICSQLGSVNPLKNLIFLVNEAKLVWGRGFFLSAACVLSPPASAWYFVHNALWKECSFTFGFINISILILPLWCFQTLEKRREQKDMSVISLWILVCCPLLLATNMSLQAKHFSPRLCSFLLCGLKCSVALKSVLIFFCPKITAAPYCMYNWCSQKIINSHDYRLSYERNQVLWNYYSFSRYAK